MSFSEKMRESLGATGVRLRVTPSTDPLTPGATLTARVDLEGGTTPAHIEALVLCLIEADRHWTAEDGGRLEEAETATLEHRDHLTAGWDRRAVAETRLPLDTDIEPSSASCVDIEFSIPLDCKPSSTSCAHTLNVQADIRGQIDPTGNARVVIARG